MDGRDADELERMLLEFWVRVIDTHEQGLRAQRELDTPDRATHMAVFLKWQHIANGELQHQRQRLEAWMSERNPRQKRGRQGWERKSKQEERDLLIWSIMREKPKGMTAYCRRCAQVGVKPLPSWEWWPGSWEKVLNHKNPVEKKRWLRVIRLDRDNVITRMKKAHPKVLGS